jgi:hypothetical protein
MREQIRPILLVSDKSVKIVENSYVNLASVEITKNDSYVIVLNNDNIKKLHEESWVNKYISLEEMTIGFLFHEVAHIKYDSFLVKTPNLSIAKYITNLLEDVRVEYKLAVDYPACSIYLKWIIFAIKKKIIRTFGSFNGKQLSKADKMLDDLFKFVRFDVIDGVDEEFLNFIFPLVMSAKRGDENNCAQIASMICYFIIEKSGIDDSDKKNSFEEKEVSTKEQEFSDAGKEILKELKELKEKTTEMKSKSNYDLVIKEEENDLYRLTVSKHSETINKIRSVFKKLFESTRKIRAYDGDLNLMKQQEAYLGSKINEDTLSYLQTKLVDPSLDFILIRDVSGSTSAMSMPYVEATICFLAAVERIKGIRTMQIDFSDKHIVNKTFDEDLRTSRINENANGGTQLFSAINKVNSLSFKGYSKLCIVVTDGEIEDIAECKSIIKELEKKGVVVAFISVEDQVKRQTSVNVKSCKIEELNVVLCEVLINNLRRR